MSREDLFCLGAVVMGIVLFLYGANYYNSLIGWAGVYIIVVGFIVRILLLIWKNLTRKGKGLETVKL